MWRAEKVVCWSTNAETRKDGGKVTMEDLWEFTNALSDATIPDPICPLPEQ